MARVAIEIPPYQGFCVQLRVRIGDINYGGHLGHDRLLSLLHEARMAFFRRWGYEESDVCGAGTVIADLAVQYLGEAFAGNELDITMTVGEISRKGFDLYYGVVRGVDAQWIARAKTALVFFDYADHKAVTIPPDFLACLKASQVEKD